MTGLSTVILPDTLRSIDTATLAGSYLPIGTVLTNGGRILRFTNLSNVTVTVSWDGINDNEILAAGTSFLLDVSAARENANYLEVQNGTQFYAKSAAGVGLFYISVYYGK